jgi:putative transposase
MPVPFRAPNTNAYVERFVQSIKQECLDHFLVFGLRHLQYLCSEYLAYYLTERPHQGRENEVLLRPPHSRRLRVQPVTNHEEPFRLANIRCQTRLGGLLKSYRRAA